MGLTAILDTNIVLYLMGGRLAMPLPEAEYAVSVMTEMELLSHPMLTPAGEAAVKQFLSRVLVLELTPDVRGAAVALRRQHRLRLPDAVIAATALVHGTELLTNDAQIAAVPGLRSRSLLLQ